VLKRYHYDVVYTGIWWHTNAAVLASSARSSCLFDISRSRDRRRCRRLWLLARLFASPSHGEHACMLTASEIIYGQV